MFGSARARGKPIQTIVLLVTHEYDGPTESARFASREYQTLAPCLDAHEKLEFFYSLSIILIFGPMHEVVNVGKNNN
jgi:hypothetical protein